MYRSKLEDVDAQLEKSVRSFFTSISTGTLKQYIRYLSQLKTAVGKELAKQKELTRIVGANPRSPTDFLKELSASVPKDVVVDLTDYQVGAAPSSRYPLPPRRKPV